MEIIDRKQPLPNATAVLILGILSLVFNGLIGLILGIIGSTLASKSWQAYNADPDAYYNYGSLNAGRIMSIIGIIKNAFVAIAAIVIWIIFGASILALISGSVCC